MSLNKVFLKVFEEAEENIPKTDCLHETTSGSNTESELFSKKEEADPELIVSHLHSTLSAEDGPHFLSISSKKEEAVRNLKIYSDSFPQEYANGTIETQSAKDNSFGNADSIGTAEGNAIYRFDHYYSGEQSENDQTNENDYEKNVISFQSERALTDSEHSVRTSTETSQRTDASSRTSVDNRSLEHCPVVNPNDSPNAMMEQSENCLDYCNLAPGKTSGAFDSDSTEPLPMDSPTDRNHFEGNFNSENIGERLEEDETDENEPAATEDKEESFYDYRSDRQAIGLAHPKSSFQKSGILQDRISLLKEKETEESKIWTGSLPAILTKLPREVAQEFFALGEFLYGKLLDGRKVFGFEGIKKDVGCSTLLLGVADELIRKGLSLLLVDAKSGDSDLLSLLQVEASEKLRTVYETCEEDCLTDIILSRDHKLPSEIKVRSKNVSNERELIRRQIKENLRKIVLQRSSENKIRKFFRYKETPIEQSPFYVLSLNHQSELKKKCANVVFKQEFQILARDFDVVLIDSGSCKTKTYGEILTDMSNFSEDGYFLVQDYRKPEREFAKELSIRSMEMQMPCLGIIENFV